MTYSSSLALNHRTPTRASRTRYSGRSQNTVSFRTATQAFGPISNTIILIVLACLLGLLYLTQVTKTNAYGYQINGLQQHQSELKHQHDDLQVASARLQSLSRIQSSAEAKNLVAVAPIDTVAN
ncbi:MAG: hypothetical protein ABIV43_03260 [Candidatus Saccharimonadales bacterium]